MIKTLTALLKRDREKLRIPHNVRDIIGINAVWKDGIFRVGREMYSKTFTFTDINYAVASRPAKESMFLEYVALLNSMGVGEHTKITKHNRRINKRDFERKILLPLAGDELDRLRREYNNMLTDMISTGNDIVQDRYLTVTVHKRNIDEARAYFTRIAADISLHFAELGSVCVEMSLAERLRIAYDFFREGQEENFVFDLDSSMRFGHDVRDYVCPDSFEFSSDYFKIGDRFARALFLRDYASYIKDSMLSEICDINRSLMLSVDFIPIPTDEAVREVENRLLGIEKNITTWQQKQNANNNFSAVVPYDLDQQRKVTMEFLDDLTTRDQRMFVGCITLVHVADTLDQLNADTEAIVTTARKHLCNFAVLKFQQMDGLRSTLPFGMQPIKNFRTLTSESLAVFTPFKAQEICQDGGIYYGQNSVSKNLIVADREQLLNGNSIVLGVSGSGKSFTAKQEVVLRRLASRNDTEIIIIDPEREYSTLVNTLGGTVINISSTSETHINALDINSDYGDDDDPLALKSDFIMSLCEQVISSGAQNISLGAKEKSIIDRCMKNVYRYYQQGNYNGVPPTLQDFHDELMRQPEEEAHGLALELELFTHGSLNTFAKHTNVDTDNSLICYDILDLGKHLLPVGMLVVLDSIWQRVTRNRQKGIKTYIFIDEIYLLFQQEYSANFLYTLWKRVRKYGAYCTGITQNVDDMLQSHTARTMLANSEFIVMLNQGGKDSTMLGELIGISEQQLGYITNVRAGSGLLKIGSSLIPFVNDFPNDTELYRLMSTKPGDRNNKSA